jgi:hypothetical protein
MTSATVRVHCAEGDCPASVALICAVILPKGWGETPDDTSDWNSLFWCPAHTDKDMRISDGRP